MKYISSLSGGVSSAIATERAIKRYGRENVVLWFADTMWEDEDLYRFIGDCMKRWGGGLTRHTDGRNPLKVGEDISFIPNQKRAPCTRILKIEPFVKYLKTFDEPVTVLLGLDWSEIHRTHAPKRNYEAIPGVSVDFPLLWKPYILENYFDIVRDEWGIDPPRLYKMGFPHNNCGGRCVKQGVKHWLRLKTHFPERFNEVRDWEQMMRNERGIDYAICRDQTGGELKQLTLAEIERRQMPDDNEPVQEDMFACFCSY